MNHVDVIMSLANSEARRARGIFLLDYDDTMINNFPYIEIKKKSNKYIINGYNYETHDNSPRMQLVCDYIKNVVFPNVDSNVNISGLYKIELHDVIQENDKSDGGCFCFSRNKSSRDDYVLLPDAFQMQNYGGLLANYSDDISWNKKSSRALFCGTTTGLRNPMLNERLQACDWAVRTARSYTDFYITKVAQMDMSDIIRCYPETCGTFFRNEYIPVEDHYKYKYLVNIAGNTCCWNRVALIMNSKSLMLSTYQSDMCWYYPALCEGIHYSSVKLSGDNLYNTIQYYEQNPLEASIIVRNANTFVKQYLSATSVILYVTMLFENIAHYFK
jgi:hypothetical protein